MNRKGRDRLIAAEICGELAKALGAPVANGGVSLAPEMLAEHNDVVCKVFDDVFDRHQIVTESAGANVLKIVPKLLARSHFALATAASRLAKTELARRRDLATVKAE